MLQPSQPDPDKVIPLNSSLASTPMPSTVDGALLLSVRSENGLGQHYLDPAHPVVRLCVDFANKISARSVLVLACGRGLTTMALMQETGVSSVVATDINQPGLDELERRVRAQSLPVMVSAFDATSKSIPQVWTGAYDLVVAKDLFPFLDPAGVDRFLANSAAALKEGGHLIFSAPSVDSRLYRESTPTSYPHYMKLSDEGKSFVQTAGDFFSFATPESLENLLRAVDLELIELHPFGREKGWMTVIARKDSSARSAPVTA